MGRGRLDGYQSGAVDGVWSRAIGVVGERVDQARGWDGEGWGCEWEIVVLGDCFGHGRVVWRVSI